MIRKYGDTQLNTSAPWGFYSRKGTRLLCSDGKVRAVAYLAGTPDTFFSTPAAVRVRGKYITGYMTIEEGLPPSDYKPTRIAYAFRHHNGQADFLPDWPQRYTQEHFDLLSKGDQTQ